jgi:hypothetical protein
MQVWKGGKVRLTETIILLIIPILIRKVYDEVVAAILIESSFVLLVPELLWLDPDEILVLFFHKLYIPPYFNG